MRSRVLGFTNVHPTEPMQRLILNTYELLTTRSSVTNVIEFGIIFKDKSGTFWNQVDSILSHETIDHALQAVGSIDLLFAMHASQNFGFFEDRSTGFPHDMHKMNLATVLSIKPRLTVPGAAGFRFAGEIEWCNAFLFPISREQFVADLRTPRAQPRHGHRESWRRLRDRGRDCSTRAAPPRSPDTGEDTWRLRFDPTAAIPPLTDTNPDQYSDDELRSAVAKVTSGLEAFLRTSSGAGEAGRPVPRARGELCHRGGVSRWTAAPSDSVHQGRLPHRVSPAAADPAHMEHKITASSRADRMGPA